MTKRLFVLGAVTALLAAAVPCHAQVTGVNTPPDSNHPIISPNGHIDWGEAVQQLKADNDDLRSKLKTESDNEKADVDQLRRAIADLGQEMHAR